MTQPTYSIEAVRPWDLLKLTGMAYTNMSGVDVDFTRFAHNPVLRAAGYFVLPLYLLTAGRGYKAVVANEIAGCAYVHPRRMSALIFNVQVNKPFRRLGIGKALMARVEEEARRRNLQWTGLQVDEGNKAAQELYLKIGYRPYHPYLLRIENPTPSLPRPNLNLSLRPMAGWEGRRQFIRYADLERREGDAWAAPVIKKDYDEGPPNGGRFWACSYQGVEEGCVWLERKRARTKLIILLAPPFWERTILHAGLVRQVLYEADIFHRRVDAYLGSSTHHRLAAAGLREYGFHETRRSRILMLKRL